VWQGKRFYRNYPTLLLYVKAATDNTLTNEHGCVPIKLFLWTMKLEYRIFICHEDSCFDFFQSFKNVKTYGSL